MKKIIFLFSVLVFYSLLIHGMGQKNTSYTDIHCFECGMQSCNAGDLDSAKFLFEQVTHDKACATALNYLAGLYQEKEDVENMVYCYQKAADKGSITALNELGIFYDGRGDMEKAKDCFRQTAASSNKKGAKKGLYNLGLAHCKTGDIEKAKISFTQALSKGCYKALKPLVEMCDTNDIEKQLKSIKHPYALAAINNLGVDFYNKNYKDTAQAMFVIAARKGLAAALYNLGMLYSKADQPTEARGYFELAQENKDRLNTNGYRLVVIE